MISVFLDIGRRADCSKCVATLVICDVQEQNVDLLVDAKTLYFYFDSATARRFFEERGIFFKEVFFLNK